VATTLEEQFRAALVNDASYAGLVTGGTFLIQIAQNPHYPCAAIQRVSTVPYYLNSPVPQSQQATVGRARLQFTCWASGSSAGATVDAIAKAVLNVLRTFNAYALPASPDTFTQAPSFLLNQRMLVEPQTQPPLFKAELDISVFYQDQ
jgi:hypothetical protein